MVHAAGRTDAGVHAMDQVVHVDVADGTDVDKLALRLNSYLANTAIAINSVVEAPAGFDARFSAIYRRYEYRITDSKAVRDPRTRRFTLWVDDELDVDAMNAAAQSLIGLHDWTTYCKPRPNATRVRELQKFEWHRDHQGVLVANIQADAFCHNMVRSIVGALIAAGEGKASPDDVAEKLAKRTRVGSYKVQPAHGLTLIEIGYPADDELEAQAERARNLRTLDEN
mgnify:CR=1 FL=1